MPSTSAAPATAPAVTARPSAAARLQSLENFLAQDPTNPHLRAEVFDLAVALGEFERAAQHLQAAREAGQDAPAWTFRQANMLLAQKRPGEARQLLLELQATTGEHPAIAHNLAWVDFVQGNFAAACERLRAWVDGATGAAAPMDVAQLAALQVLWLRALHRQTLLDEAWAWVQVQLTHNNLSAPAAGVASLIAVDADHMDAVKALSEAALAQDAWQMEALVARATIALAARDVPLARNLLGTALNQNPSDGRAMSALGFAELMATNIVQARACLEQAVALMPTHVGTWIGLGWTRLMQQDLPGARQAFEQAIALDRNFGESHGGLAVILALSGNRAGAQESIERALGLDKSNLSARYAKALLAGEANDAQAIQKLARRLLGGRSAPLGGDMAGWLPKEEGGEGEGSEGKAQD